MTEIKQGTQDPEADTIVNLPSTNDIPTSRVSPYGVTLEEYQRGDHLLEPRGMS